MKKSTLPLILLVLVHLFRVNAQTELSGTGYDSKGNKYVVGSFDGSIELGNHNTISSVGPSMFIAKYDSKNICQWATKISGTADVSDIAVEANGSFFITGNISNEVKFGELKIKANGAVNFFVAKYNISGDPVWVKTASSASESYGNSIASDHKGSIYILGTFNNKIIFDGQTLGTDGKSDFCVFKMNTSGKTEWQKACGAKKIADNGTSISFINGKLLIGGSSIVAEGKSNGYIGQLNADNGNMEWDVFTGNSTGNINKIIADKNSGNYIVTGYIGGDNINGMVNNDFYISKINAADGKAIWATKYRGYNDRGIDIATDDAGNIYAAGMFEDSLHIGNIMLNGFSKADIFLAKFSPDGQVKWAQSFGDNKRDVISRMTIHNNTLELFGNFSNRIKFSKKELSAEKDDVFYALLNTDKMEFTDAGVLVKSLSNFSEVNSNGIYGKLLKGSGMAQTFLNDQPVSLENDRGEIIKNTITDENGDFSFKNVDKDNTLSLVIDKSDNLKETDEVYLAQQNGIVMQKMEMGKDKKFKYSMLPAIVNKLAPMEDIDPNIKMKEFKTSAKMELSFVENILYNPNEFEVPADVFTRLNQVAVYLRQNPKMKLEIDSHTDSFGDDSYNLSLSDKRANAVKDYLLKKGIQTERIAAKGFGETAILNRCANNIICSEKEHAFNRRTEFKFTK